MLVRFQEYRCQPNPPPRVQFSDLPLEVRDLIWEYSLADERVFHIKGIHHRSLPGQGLSHPPVAGTIRFHQEYRPPVATRVCTESRRAAWRIGCFLFPRPPSADTGRLPVPPGIWCNPRSDILYIDRNQRNALQTLAAIHTTAVTADSSNSGGDGEPPQRTVIIPGLDRMERVALEWRWFLQDGSKRPSTWSDLAMRAYWAAKTDRLYAYLPAMTTLLYVLPQVRYQGGIPWGREPRELLASHRIVLTELPRHVVVPIESGHEPWVRVEEELRAALGNAWQCEDKRARFGGRVKYPPRIEGRWLLREGAKTDYGPNSTIKAFVA